jgi:hypothetical protein
MSRQMSVKTFGGESAASFGGAKNSLERSMDHVVDSQLLFVYSKPFGSNRVSKMYI